MVGTLKAARLDMLEDCLLVCCVIVREMLRDDLRVDNRLLLEAGMIDVVSRTMFLPHQ